MFELLVLILFGWLFFVPCALRVGHLGACEDCGGDLDDAGTSHPDRLSALCRRCGFTLVGWADYACLRRNEGVSLIPLQWLYFSLTIENVGLTE